MEDDPEFDVKDAYPKLDAFLAKLGASRRWSEEMVERIRAVGEEGFPDVDDTRVPRDDVEV